MLDLDISTIIWEIVNFLILTVILYFLVFKPMTKRAAERAAEKATLRAALQADAEATAAKLAEIDERLLKLDDEIEEITDQAYINSQVHQRDLLTAAQEEANMLVMTAVDEARKEHVLDIQHSQSELVESVLQISNDTLLKVTPPKVHDSLIDDLVRSIWNMGKDDMRSVQNLRDSLVDRIPTVEITVPRELTIDHQNKLLSAFNGLTDKEVDFDIKIDPTLVGGIRARIGDILMDNSIGSHLNSLRDEINQKLDTLAATEDD